MTHPNTNPATEESEAIRPEAAGNASAGIGYPVRPPIDPAIQPTAIVPAKTAAELSPADDTEEVHIEGLEGKAQLINVFSRIREYRDGPFKALEWDYESDAKFGSDRKRNAVFYKVRPFRRITRLFDVERKDPMNRVIATAQQVDAVSEYVEQNALPWANGTYLLNMAFHDEFKAGLRKLIKTAEESVKELVASWNAEVQVDLRRRIDKIESRRPRKCSHCGELEYYTPRHWPSPDDYPRSTEIAEMLEFSVTTSLIPDTDFRTGIDEEDRKALNRQFKRAKRDATKQIIKRLLEEAKTAVSSLSSREVAKTTEARNSLLDGVERAATNCKLFNDPDIMELIAEMRELAHGMLRPVDDRSSSLQINHTSSGAIEGLMDRMQGII